MITNDTLKNHDVNEDKDILDFVEASTKFKKALDKIQASMKKDDTDTSSDTKDAISDVTLEEFNAETEAFEKFMKDMRFAYPEQTKKFVKMINSDEFATVDFFAAAIDVVF